MCLVVWRVASDCLLRPNGIQGHGNTNSLFPEAYFTSKKYKALSDGFRTAYNISGTGELLGFLDLDSHTAYPPAVPTIKPQPSPKDAARPRLGLLFWPPIFPDARTVRI